MKDKKSKNISPYKFIAISWLIGCLNIIYQGQQDHPYKIMHDPQYVPHYPVEAVLFTCAFFSIYFIVLTICIITSFRYRHPVLSYMLCSLIVIGQCIIAGFGAMHAPPYWGALIINLFLLFLFQLFVIPTLFKKQKKE